MANNREIYGNLIFHTKVSTENIWKSFLKETAYGNFQ